MNATAQALSAGFSDPVHDAQQAFRAALDALSRPGQRVAAGQPVPNLPLGPAMAHLLLALTDTGTDVWWQDSAEVAALWLRFHTGAGLAQAPGGAAFACISSPAAMPALDAFLQGTAVSPEFSTTLLIEVPSFDGGPLLHWYGPGIREAQAAQVAGMLPTFWTQWQANHAGFPLGVDVIFTCGGQALGLPRTTRVSRLEGIA